MKALVRHLCWKGLVAALGAAACAGEGANGGMPPANTSAPTSTSPSSTITAATTDTGVAPSADTGAPPGPMVLASSALPNSSGCSVEAPEACAVFPPEHTSYMNNTNLSPPLVWSGVPSGTASFALKFSDVTFGQTHWAIWNIPANVTSLAAGIASDSPMPAAPAGASQTNATFADGDGYFGPQAPCNVYEFVLYALSTATFAPTKPEFVTLVSDELEGLGDAILAKATLSGRNFVAGECE